MLIFRAIRGFLVLFAFFLFVGAAKPGSHRKNPPGVPKQKTLIQKILSSLSPSDRRNAQALFSGLSRSEKNALEILVEAGSKMMRSKKIPQGARMMKTNKTMKKTMADMPSSDDETLMMIMQQLPREQKEIAWRVMSRLPLDWKHLVMVMMHAGGKILK